MKRVLFITTIALGLFVVSCQKESIIKPIENPNIYSHLKAENGKGGLKSDVQKSIEKHKKTKSLKIITSGKSTRFDSSDDFVYITNKSNGDTLDVFPIIEWNYNDEPLKTERYCISNTEVVSYLETVDGGVYSGVSVLFWTGSGAFKDAWCDHNGYGNLIAYCNSNYSCIYPMGFQDDY